MAGGRWEVSLEGSEPTGAMSFAAALAELGMLVVPPWP